MSNIPKRMLTSVLIGYFHPDVEEITTTPYSVNLYLSDDSQEHTTNNRIELGSVGDLIIVQVRCKDGNGIDTVRSSPVNCLQENEVLEAVRKELESGGWIVSPKMSN